MSLVKALGHHAYIHPPHPVLPPARGQAPVSRAKLVDLIDRALAILDDMDDDGWVKETFASQ